MRKQSEKKENLNKEEFITLLNELDVDKTIVDEVKSLPNELNKFNCNYRFNANVSIFNIGNGFCNYSVNYVDDDNNKLLKERIFTKPHEIIPYIINNEFTK